MIKLNYEVLEVTNFLDEDKSQFILDYMTSIKFRWLYSNNQENKYYSAVCKDLIKHISPSEIVRIKANLTTNVDTYRNVFDYHTDFENIKNGMTSIYYVNTNNGGTAFENGKFVKSEQNKIVTFPMNLKHRTVPHTDNNYERIVININYIRD